MRSAEDWASTIDLGYIDAGSDRPSDYVVTETWRAEVRREIVAALRAYAREVGEAVRDAPENRQCTVDHSFGRNGGKCCLEEAALRRIEVKCP